MTDPLPVRGPFEAELDRLQQMLLEMAGRAEELVRMSMECLSARDRGMTRRVRQADDRIDELEVEMDERVLELLALRHPMAGDLRLVFVALKASNDIERIGDHAVNIAKASRRMTRHPPLPDILEIEEMGGQVRTMLGDALDAMARGIPRSAAKRISASAPGIAFILPGGSFNIRSVIAASIAAGESPSLG